MKPKSQLRSEFLEKRNKLSAAELNEKSSAIALKLLASSEFKSAKAIFCYVSFNSEVETHFFIKESLKLGKKVAVPHVDFKYEKMMPSLIKNFERDLEKTRIGILEPKEFAINPVEPEEIDLIIVPGVVFDLHGHRVGSGKGYYDKFLEKIHSGAKLIGIAFDLQILGKIAKEEHDIKMHKIITEKRVINCE